MAKANPANAPATKKKDDQIQGNGKPAPNAKPKTKEFGTKAAKCKIKIATR